jgi:hypothetical protein
MSLDAGDPVVDRFLRALGEVPGDEPLFPQRLDLERATAADVEVAQVTWANRVVDEARSVVLCSELLRLLADTGAPSTALTAVRRVLGDELRHAQLCYEAVRKLGGWELYDLDLTDLELPPSSDPPPVRAIEIAACALWVMEAESVPVLRAYADATAEPALRELLRTLVRDEARHAATGKAVCEQLLEAFPTEARAVGERLPSLVRRERARLVEATLAAAVGGPGRCLGGCITRDDLLRVRRADA